MEINRAIEAQPAGGWDTPLPRSFYEPGAVEVARALLNCRIVRPAGADLLIGRISETEAYTQDDASCHAFRGLTPRNAVMFGPGGHAYVYFTYGMHYCVNAVAGPAGRADAVLIRAFEPIAGWETMRERRGMAPLPLAQLAPVRHEREARLTVGGPARLCQALGIDRELNGTDLTIAGPLWIAPPDAAVGHASDPDILATPRIGIRQATDYPWRFTLAGDFYTSRP